MSTSDRATILEEKLKEKEKQIRLAKVTNPKIVEAMEHLTTENEEMAGIIECPAVQQRTLTKTVLPRYTLPPFEMTS